LVRTLLCTEEARLVAEPLRRAEAVDAAYGPDRSGDELREEWRNRESRLRKIREAQAALEAEARALEAPKAKILASLN
jgi:hypothetical protein